MDLPLKSNCEIETFLLNHYGMEFISIENIQPNGLSCTREALPIQLQEKVGAFAWSDRVRYWHPAQNLLGRKKGARAVDSIMVAIQRSCGVNRFDDFDGWLAKGANWFSITHELAAYVVGSTSEILQRFGSSRCADELFLQTLIVNSPFVDRLYFGEPEGVPASLRHIDWKRGRPYIFRESDFNELTNSPALFARKFDAGLYPNAVDELCNWVASKNGTTIS